MGNRSRFLSLGTAAAATAAVAARRRTQARRVAEGIADTILPSQVEPPYEVPALRDPGEAPGHAHRIAGDRGEGPPRRSWPRLGGGRRQPPYERS